MGWSAGARAASAAMLAQIASGWVAAARGARIDGGTLVIAIALGIGSIVVLARCRMPTGAKALLIAAACASLLTVIATQDLLGLRAVERATGGALADAAEADGRPPSRRATPAAVTASDAGARRAADALAGTLDRRLAEVEADASVAATIQDTPAGYRVNWSLVRGADRQWCGLHTEGGAAAPAFPALADHVIEAARRSRGGPLRCE